MLFVAFVQSKEQLQVASEKDTAMEAHLRLLDEALGEQLPSKHATIHAAVKLISELKGSVAVLEEGLELKDKDLIDAQGRSGEQSQSGFPNLTLVQGRKFTWLSLKPGEVP